MGKVQSARPKVDSDRKAAFETRFPRLRLVSLETFPKADDWTTFSVSGAGADLIDAGFLTAPMINALPRCGVKYFNRDDTGASGLSCSVHRTKRGFRVVSSLDSSDTGDVFTIFGTLREILGLSSAGPDAVPPGGSTEQQWKDVHHDSLGGAFAGFRHLRAPLPELKDVHESIYGARFQFARADVQRIDSILNRFREELHSAIDRAAVIDTEQRARPTHLRLVVDNDSASQP